MNSFVFPALGFLNLGPWEIALILFLALLLFGGKKLPGLAKDLGQGIREFRRSITASDDDSRTEAVVYEDSTPKLSETSVSKTTTKKSPVKKSKKKA
jgi:sec-independent protein translocase protein TatA